MARAQLQSELAPVPGKFEIKAEYSYLSTSANYPYGGGGAVGLPNGGKYTNMAGLGQLTFDVTKQARLYAAFSGSQANSTGINLTETTAFNVITETNTSTGFNDVSLGAQWWWSYQDFDVVPQFDFLYPTWRVDPNGTGPLTSDAAMRIQAGTWLRYNFVDWVPFAYLGYAYRDEGLSSLMPYAVGLQFAHSEAFWVEGQFRGYQSVVSDTSTSTQYLRNFYLNQVDGGSYQYYAINPSQAEVALSTGVRFGSLGAYVGGSMTVFGQGSASSWTVIAGLTFTAAAFAPPPQRDQYFNPPSDNYNDKLFKQNTGPDKTPPEAPAEEEPGQVERRVEKPKVPREKKPAAPAPDGPLPDVQLLMKQTEKKLDK